MPLVLTSKASISCAHGGRVAVRPGQQSVTIDGGAIMCDPDLTGATIAGCSVPSTTTSKPCMTVVSSLPGSSSQKVLVGGRPVLLSTLQGMTDGVPPGTLIVQDPGQTRVQA